KRYKLNRKLARALNERGGGQAKFWFIYWGGIPTEWFTAVEMKEQDGTYRPLDQAERRDLVSRIAEERKRFTVRDEAAGVFSLNGEQNTWLFDLLAMREPND